MAGRYAPTYPAAIKYLLADRHGLTAYLRLPLSTTAGFGIRTSSSGPSARPAAAPRLSAAWAGAVTGVWAGQAAAARGPQVA